MIWSIQTGSDARNHNVSQFGGANNQVSDVGNHLVSMPQPHLNTMNSNVPTGKSKSKSKLVRITESGVSAVSTKMGDYKEFKTDQPIQVSLRVVVFVVIHFVGMLFLFRFHRGFLQ